MLTAEVSGPYTSDVFHSNLQQVHTVECIHVTTTAPNCANQCTIQCRLHFMVQAPVALVHVLIYIVDEFK